MPVPGIIADEETKQPIDDNPHGGPRRCIRADEETNQPIPELNGDHTVEYNVFEKNRCQAVTGRNNRLQPFRGLVADVSLKRNATERNATQQATWRINFPGV